MVELCAGLLQAFERAGVSVIRMGLHAAADLQQNLLAGPLHPAFRGAVRKPADAPGGFQPINHRAGGKNMWRFTSIRALSRMIGQKKAKSRGARRTTLSQR